MKIQLTMAAERFPAALREFQAAEVEVAADPKTNRQQQSLEC